MSGKKFVVGIEEREEFAARLVDAGVTRGTAAAIVLPDVADARIPQRIDHCLRVVL